MANKFIGEINYIIIIMYASCPLSNALVHHRTRELHSEKMLPSPRKTHT